MNLKDENKIFFEFGCGVGNTIFPLLKKFSGVIFYGVDFSKNAINCILNNPEYKNESDRIFGINIIFY